MTSTKKDPVIVVLQLTGGNDYFNTVIPYNDPLYYDNRPAVQYRQEDIIKVDDQLGFAPTMGPIKELYDQGKVAVSPRHRLRRLPQVPLPLHGHLAHLRAGQGRHRGLGRQARPRAGPQQGERTLRHQLRPWPPPRPGGPRCPPSPPSPIWRPTAS